MISTVVVSYKRPEMLRFTLDSYLDTVSEPYELLIVDNGSCPQAIEIAHEYEVPVLELGENRFPGYSTNAGWDHLGGELLHRSDNDIEYLDGWCGEVRRMFELYSDLGQLGLRTIQEEGNHPNVGGNCVVRRDVFEQVRWSEDPWRPGVKGEDFFFSQAVVSAGFNWMRAERPCIIHRGAEWPQRPTDEYYKESWGARGHW